MTSPGPRLRTLPLFAVLAGVLLCVRSAAAQAAPADGLYLTATAFVDVKRFSGDTATNVLDGNPAGGGVAIGTRLSDRWELEAALDVPASSARLEPRSVTVRRTVITVQSRVRNRLATGSALVRFRTTRHGRVQLGYLAGLSVARLQRQFDTLAPDGTPAALIPRPVESLDYAVAPTLGVDGRVTVTRHLSIVPALHLAVFAFQDVDGLAVRPRVGIRWTF